MKRKICRGNTKRDSAAQRRQRQKGELAVSIDLSEVATSQGTRNAAGPAGEDVHQPVKGKKSRKTGGAAVLQVSEEKKPERNDAAANPLDTRFVESCGRRGSRAAERSEKRVIS